MADGTHFAKFDQIEAPLALNAAIALLEQGAASEDITVDLGDGTLTRAYGRLGLKGLLQRLRGYRTILALNAGEISEGVVAMRSGKPDMHPDVAIILDALKDHG
jgi:hypothetical protein